VELRSAEMEKPVEKVVCLVGWAGGVRGVGRWGVRFAYISTFCSVSTCLSDIHIYLVKIHEILSA
jgi:hypothetical protein